MVYHYSLWSWCSSRFNPYAYEPEFNDKEAEMLFFSGFPHSYAFVSKTSKSKLIETHDFSGFVSVLAVYVTGKYKSSNPKCYTATPPDTCPLAPEQVINSALYGVMLAILICLALNWCMDMETQFKLMLGMQALTHKYESLPLTKLFTKKYVVESGMHYMVCSLHFEFGFVEEKLKKNLFSFPSLCTVLLTKYKLGGLG